MAHHAFVTVGTQEETVARARDFASSALGLHGISNPDIRLFTFGLFSVEDARKVTDTAYQTGTGSQKLIIIYAGRLFHESQNALLKIFEEPPEGVTIIIGVPSVGQILPTLRSRLLPLPENVELDEHPKGHADEFLTLSAAEQEKYIAKLIEKSKSDKDDVKQGARGEAAQLLTGITERAHEYFLHEENTQKKAEILAFLEDISVFMPLLYERSAPLKLIFEHILLVIPKSLKVSKV